MLYLSMVQAAVNFSNRYRLPVEGYVLILAVGGAGWLFSKVLSRVRSGQEAIARTSGGH